MADKKVHNNVLVVDDDLRHLHSVSSLLKRKGYAVSSCSYANEALSKLQEDNIDVVLSDIRMPDVSGVELLEKIHKINNKLPVILMTAYTDLDAAVDAVKDGAFEFLIKPMPPDYLILSIKRAFKHIELLTLKENYRLYLEDTVRERTQELEKENAERKRAQESLQKSEKQLRELASRLQEVEETERKKLAHELHDRVGQTLTGLSINLNLIQNQLSSGLPDSVGARLDDSMKLVEEIAWSIRDVMDELRPEVLDDYGLVPALRWYGSQFEKRTGISTNVLGEALPVRPPEEIESALFRISQEALTNVAKHAGASRVKMSFKKKNAQLMLTIADNGKGFDLSAVRGSKKKRGWGLLTMQERVQALGGKFYVAAKPGKGTTIVVEVKEKSLG